jgi:TetR/AcrR family transcriptional regulator, transcriptional repressor for nem operon
MPKEKYFNEEEVLDKALNLFWQQGYEATSMQNLVDTLQISRSSLYETFTDKYNLYLQCLSQYKANNIEAIIKKAHDYSSNPLDFILLIYKQVINSISCDKQRKGCYILNASAEFGTTDAAIYTLVLQNNKMFIQLFEQLINKAVKLRQIPKAINVQQMALMLYATICSIQVLGRAKHTITELKAIANFTLAHINICI